MLGVEPLDKMALADRPDYLSSEEYSGGKKFNYSNFLPQNLIDSGYKLSVEEVRRPYGQVGVFATVTHPSSTRHDKYVGGYYYEKKPSIVKGKNFAFTHAMPIVDGHRRLNLGKYSLLALLTHGFKHGGIDTVQTHEGHTLNAEKAHRWVISQENLGEGQNIPPTETMGGDPNVIRGYRYTLKNEQPILKAEGRGSMLANGRYAVYHMIPKEDGVHKHLSSVFAIKNGGFHLLEDYADIFTKYHTQDGDQPSRLLEQRIHNLVNNSSYYKVIPTKEDNIRSPDSRHKMVTPEDINSGRQAFVYHSPHHNGPSQLVYDKGSFSLNGYPLSIDELKHIKESVEGGTGKVSYPEDMFKAEDNFSAIPEPDDFFDTDYMCPQIGNLHAYRNFVGGEPKGGSHIFLTSDAVKKVLEDDGVKSHNDILIAIATMLDKAASVPDESGRVFHVGHDSYYVYMPSYESGLQFLYNLQGLINEMPTIYSKHPYFDIGMSDELEEAFNALTQVGEYKEHDGQEGNHVMIHTNNTTRYVSPSDIL